MISDDLFGRRRVQLVVAVAITVLLCGCSVFQMELVVLTAARLSKMTAGLQASPPPLFRSLLALRALARVPWEIGMFVLYVLPLVVGIRGRLMRWLAIQALLWLVFTTLFFFALWVAFLPFGSCCV